MELSEFQKALQVNYNLDDDITDRLCLRSYVTNEKGKKTPKYICDKSSVLGEWMANGSHDLVVENLRGQKREEDVSCDSKFMVTAMEKVGKAIREAFHWVDKNWPIFLYLDNAGGHGKQYIVDKYVADLWDYHKVKCIHQVPRSPCTNMLDLGVWMAFQNVIEKKHRGR